MYVYNIFKAVIIIGFSYVIYLKTSKWTASFLRKFITGMAYVIIFSAFMWKLSACVSEPFKSIWIVLFSSGFLMAATKEVLDNVITSMIISYAASHMLFLLTSIAAVVITVIFYWIRNDYIDKALFQGIMDVVVWRITLLAFIMEVMIAMIFMRFKISISESQKRLASSVGVSISGIIVIFYSLSRQETLSNRGWALLMSGIALCAAGLLCCFKKDTIVAYNDKVRELIVERLKIKLKDTQDANDFLENVAHRDSKLLPAYRRAVEEFMKSVPDGEGKSKAMELLRELKTAEREKSYEIYNKLQKRNPLPSTGMVLLDAVFAYMFNRAMQKGIDFDLIIGSNLSGITGIITQAQLETLAADLVENAITATEHSGDRYKSILVYFWVSHGAYELWIDDSGEPFEIDIIIQLGKRRVTTHADKGGNGIGFMSIFEILRLCGASLIITERPAMAYQHSKSVAVRFDGKNQKVICSYRAEDIALNNDGSWTIEDFDEKTYCQGDMKF